MIKSEDKVAILGLGYVGLPLAVEFGKVRSTIGFDINAARIEELVAGHDSTREVEPAELAAARHLTFATELSTLADCKVFIITVPTPIDAHKRPDLSPLLSASEAVGRILKPGDIVVYESTVYPGATEEDCVPVLERTSGLKFNEDFFCGYSPERINPGDKKHRLPSIKKVTSGSTDHVAQAVDKLYQEIIHAGTYRATSIRVAEAAKVIENTQRDLNIALINELSIIFDKMKIDTNSVLEAAGTKWNFLPFSPGLVGGHCIGVDPYYLTHKAESLGYNPQVILAGRRINDGMGAFVANQLVKEMIKKGIGIKGAKALVLGLSFKENCPDIRNTKVVDVIHELNEYGMQIDVHDPWVDNQDAKKEYSIELLDSPSNDSYDAILLLVPHDVFVARGAETLRQLGKTEHVLVDLKSCFEPDQSEIRL